MKSALYEGRVRHRRRETVNHEFEYSMALVALDLDELETVFAGRWLWSTSRFAFARFRRSDFHGDPSRPLKDAVLDTVSRETGRVPTGRVVLVANLRYFGISFNPVSFYYCHDADGSLAAIAAEITNTPWLERFTYVLDVRSVGSGPLRFQFDKKFHVSPFLAMDYQYDWTFTPLGERVVVHMENRKGDAAAFDATLTLRRRDISGRSLASMLVRHPFQTVGVVVAIYYQALRLRLKGAPFHVHPRSRFAAD